ncbi:unnamed protein product [Adineta steineri]|uniref:Bulb-type lectin domain-containing protein n=1 Tax=Adineta steineri TaxID=433720 RepID=A0A815X0A6_9BILA|nr:unnamed protein product [Adineta steineri]CAF1661280.1 unnamed protein product [Adineta steineri]
MRSVTVLFFIIFLSSIKGQTTQLPNYSCSENNASIQFTLSSSSHSAWNPTSSCSLQQCNTSLNGNNNCLSSSTPCFDYRTINNISYCAPGILCSISETCNNITQTCLSNNSVCVINSCCSSQAVCLPFLATQMCNTAILSTICVSAGKDAILNASQFIYSPTQQLYAAGMLNNQFGVYQAYGYGNVTSTSIWTANQSSTPTGASFVAQDDGNLVVYTAGESPIWAIGADNGGASVPYCLKMLDSGNLIWVNNANAIIWQSNSSG